MAPTQRDGNTDLTLACANNFLSADKCIQATLCYKRERGRQKERVGGSPDERCSEIGKETHRYTEIKSADKVSGAVVGAVVALAHKC